MQRRTQGVVALGASAILGMVAGVLVSTTGPGREVTDPSATPSSSSIEASPSSGTNPAAVPGAPTTTPSPDADPTPTVRRSPAPTATETEDDRGRGRGRGGDSGSDSDNSGPGSGDDDDSGDDG